MTDTNHPANDHDHPRKRLPGWAGILIVALAAVVVLVLGLLAASIMEHRWEAQRPAYVFRPMPEFEPDNAVWGQSYPREYETYRMTDQSDTLTRFGGSVPRDYLEEDPRKVILYAGTTYALDYTQARGHYNALYDVTHTPRTDPELKPDLPGTCMTCKSTDVVNMLAEMGKEEFYAANFHDHAKVASHPLGCQDCHDPETLQLRITRPGLQEGLASMGIDFEKASHQDMRSLVCAQCHVEYYFKKEPENYLTFPWAKGRTVEDMIEYYDEIEFSDWIHPISGAPMIKMQHPDYELYTTGIHAYRGVACADCHMPYKSEGSAKFTNHHVQSPLLNVANSCAVCHRWSEEEIVERVYSIQSKVKHLMDQAEIALARAHFDLGAASQAGANDDELENPRYLLRHAQARWDYVAASNGMGFHSPQESTRILGDAANQAQQVRILAARILARHGVTEEPRYPDYSTKQAAQALIQQYAQGNAPNLLP